MKIFMKKWLLRVTAGLMALSALGFYACGGAGASVGGGSESGGNSIGGSESGGSAEAPKLIAAPAGAPDYSEYADTEFLIGAWNPTPANKSYNEKMFTYAKQAGINFLCDLRAAQHPDGRTAKRIAEVEAAGLRTFINLSGYTYDDLKEETFFNSPAFMGFNFWDEPSYSRFESLEASAAEFRKDFPDKLAYINLLPNYATKGQLGKDTYREYVESFAAEVSSVTHLSYDFYPLVGKMSGDMVMSHGLNSLWLSSLETMANAAKSAGKDFWAFVQCMSFGVNNRAPQSTADITFQNYVNMCFGVRALQYFCLTSPNLGGEFGEFDVGMLDRDYEPTSNFTYVKEANEELNSFAYVYQQFAWENTMPVYGAKFSDLSLSGFDMLVNPLERSEYFEAAADSDALIGQFEDANGYKGYMVVNFSDPMDFRECDLTMSFNADKVLVFANGKSEIVEIPGGNYTCTLAEGEGRFLIPFNEKK